MSTTRNDRRILVGTVTSTKGTKTVTVEVERTFKHAKYGKFVRRKKKFMAHDEAEAAKAGDRVEIAATRPLSKRKRWRMVRVLDHTELPDTGDDQAEAMKALAPEGEPS